MDNGTLRIITPKKWQKIAGNTFNIIKRPVSEGLYEMELAKQHDAEAEARRSQIGTGDRSEKIRTYNFPQGRVTDHRIKLTLYKIDAIMDGDIQELIDNLTAADQAAKLAKMNQNVIA